MSRELKVGDVIKCGDFAYCERVEKNMFSPSKLVEAASKGSPHIKIEAGARFTKHVCLTRGNARFVIEHGPGTDSSFLLARRLNKDGSYCPTGETVRFSIDSDRSDDAVVKVVGKMKILFVR